MTAPHTVAGHTAGIDWNAPIEAVHIVTGEATPATFIEACNDGTDDVAVAVAGVPDTFEVFGPDGRAWIGEQCEYRIRNVAAIAKATAARQSNDMEGEGQ